MNNCIKPVQFLYTTWGTRLCTCYILPRSGNECVQGGLRWEIWKGEGRFRSWHLIYKQYMLVCPLMGGMVPLILTVRTTAGSGNSVWLRPVLHNVCVLLHPSWTCAQVRALWPHLWQILAAIPPASSSSRRCRAWSCYELTRCLAKENCQGRDLLEQMTSKDAGMVIRRRTERLQLVESRVSADVQWPTGETPHPLHLTDFTKWH